MGLQGNVKRYECFSQDENCEGRIVATSLAVHFYYVE